LTFYEFRVGSCPEVIEAAEGISDDDFSLREKTKHHLAAYVGNTPKG